MPYATPSAPSRLHPAREAPLAAPAAVVLSDELARLVDRLVDAIDVRESYEPEIASWDTALRIRRLERELVLAWGASRRRVDAIATGEVAR